MTVRCRAPACVAATEDVDCCCVLSCKEKEEEEEDSTHVFLEKAPVCFFVGTNRGKNWGTRVSITSFQNMKYHYTTL